ncbi:hypothetical protein ACLOJK_008485 [Asimina triloba]
MRTRNPTSGQIRWTVATQPPPRPDPGVNEQIGVREQATAPSTHPAPPTTASDQRLRQQSAINDKQCRSSFDQPPMIQRPRSHDPPRAASNGQDLKPNLDRTIR